MQNTRCDLSCGELDVFEWDKWVGGCVNTILSICSLFGRIKSRMYIDKSENKMYNNIIGGEMRKRKIYLDTSAISHLQAPDVEEKQNFTLDMWELFEKGMDYEVYTSVLALNEISECEQEKREFLLSCLSNIDVTILQETQEVINLAKAYLTNNVLKGKSYDDLVHIAYATVNNVDYIVSWNFKHFVNIRTIELVNAINMMYGYGQVKIVPPSMIGGVENDK